METRGWLLGSAGEGVCDVGTPFNMHTGARVITTSCIQVMFPLCHWCFKSRVRLVPRGPGGYCIHSSHQGTSPLRRRLPMYAFCHFLEVRTTQEFRYNGR